jgi:hypothetical protein
MNSLIEFVLNFHLRFFRRRVLIVFFFFNMVNSVFATLNYGLTVSNPGYTALAGGTLVSNFNWGCQDQMVSSLLPIGFTFVYDGISYTQFEVSDNGELFLGGSYTCSSNCGGSCNFSEIEPTNSNGFAATADRPAICPLWDDLGFNSSGSHVSYLTSGGAGNHILTVEWLLMDWKVNNTATPHGSISFQIVLYESPTGQIDFIYKRESQLLGSGTQAPHAKIGLMGAMGDYYSTDDLGSTPSKTIETTVTAKPADGALFRWTDPTSLPIELLFFKGISQKNNVLLSWETATEIDNNYFTLSRSNDGIDFKVISTVKGAGNSDHPLFYNYTDILVPNLADLSYYKLAQTDFNGKTTSYNMIAVTAQKNITPYIYFDQSSGVLVISNVSSQGAYFTVNIIDILGRSLYQEKMEIQDRGNGVYSVFIELPQEGIYSAVLSEANGNILSQSKFIK